MIVKGGFASPRLTKNEREEIHLTDKEKEVLVGLLLGDGHIQQRLKMPSEPLDQDNIRLSQSLTGNSRLKYAQIIKHDAYFNHVFDLFKHYCTVNFTKIEGSYTHSVTKVSYKSFTFMTIFLPSPGRRHCRARPGACFNEYLNLFYLNNIKIVPKNIEE